MYSCGQIQYIISNFNLNIYKHSTYIIGQNHTSVLYIYRQTIWSNGSSQYILNAFK